MAIHRRVFIGLIGAAMLAPPARAADKIVGGTLGGQAPLWPFYVAARKGFFAGEDLDVEINFAQSGPAVAQQLTGGAFDVALSIGNDNAIHAIDKGAPLAIVRIIGNTAPYALIAKPELKTIADLKGKTIGISVIGGGTQGPFNMLLKQNGVDPAKDIKLVEVGFAVSEDALRQGRVDAVNMNQPFAARAEAKGGTRKLFSLNQAMPNIVHILEACRADFVDKNPELVKAYVRDITLGMKKALANREETLKVVSEQLKAPIPVLDTYLLKDNDFGRDPGAAPNFEAIQKMLDIYTATGMLPKMDVAQFKHPTIVAPLQ